MTNAPLPPSHFVASLRAWGLAHVWNIDTLFEILFIALSFTLGAIVARILSARAQKAIDASKLALRTKRLARSMRRLIFPLCSFVILGAFSEAAGSELIGMDVSLCEAAMKMLVAWLAIRLSLQFIDNPFVRSLFTWVIWVVAALSIFRVLDQTMAALDSMAISMGSMRVSALEVIKGSMLLMILLYLALFISTFFERRVLKAKGITRSSQVLIAKMIRMALITVAIIIGITSSGIDLSIFTIFSGALGLGIGFGLQRSVSNLFSGLLLLMDQSIKPGDVIELDQHGTFGWVNQMAARYTEVVTRDNKSYLIPNEDFVTQRVVNWSHGNSLIRLDIAFGVHYDSNPHDVIRIALDTARNHGGRIVSEPAPVCYLKEFGDSSLNFTLRFWITDAEQGLTNIRGSLLLALWDAFKANGIQIPYPHREVFLHERKAS